MRMNRKRSKRLRDERRARELDGPVFPHVMRMTRQRARRLRKMRLLEGIRLPAFPRLLRMSRRRKRQMREKEELSRGLTQVAAASFTAIYVTHLTPHQVRSAPLTTFTDVSSYFDYMKNARDRIQGHKEAEENLARAKEGRFQAEKDWLAAQEGIRQAEEGLNNAEELLTAVEQQESKIRIALQRARDAQEVQAGEILRRRQALEDFLPQVYAQREEAERLSALASEREDEYLSYQSSHPVTAGGESAVDPGRAEIIEDTWKSVDYAQNRLNDVYAMVEAQMAGREAPAPSLGQSEEEEERAAYYEERMEAARQEADDAQAVLDGLESQLDALRDMESEALDAEADARQEIADLEGDQRQAESDRKEAEKNLGEAQKWLAESRLWLMEAEKSVDQAASEEIRAEYELEHFGEGHSYGIGMEYYSWQGNHSGHQLYFPMEVSGEEKGWDWAVSTGYTSSSSGKEKGSVNGWTATDISVALHNDHLINDVRYRLTLHLPTGPSDVHENANLPEDLARMDSFNTGWNWTPQVEAVHRASERDSITGRMSWTWRGSYDFRWDALGEERNATASPGNIWRKEIEYLHAGEHQQFLGILSHQSTTSAQVGDSWYKDGDEIVLKLFYSRDVSPKDSWRAYSVIGHGAGTKTRDPMASGGSVWRQYYGLGWTHEIRRGESWWAMVNYMKMKGSDYNFANGQPISDRQRWSLQLGYDHRMDERSMLRLKLERFSMRDAAAGNYHGWNSAVMFYHTF